MILIGSRALAIQAPHLLSRKPFDFDFIATQEEYNSWVDENDVDKVERVSENKVVVFVDGIPCEFEIIREDKSNRMFLELVENDPQTQETAFGLVPSLDALFTLKTSHRFKKDSPHFWKNAMDYHRMKAAGAVVRPEWKKFLKLREKETYKHKHPKLNVAKADFFSGDGIDYVWDHDTIHLSIKNLDRPAYMYFKPEDSDVMCDKKMFWEASEEVRLFSVLEESCVLAIERSLVPHPGILTPKKAFALALSKVCSSITSGWWRTYAYDNIFNVMKMYDDSYFERFKAGVESGIVQPHKKEEV